MRAILLLSLLLCCSALAQDPKKPGEKADEPDKKLLNEGIALYSGATKETDEKKRRAMYLQAIEKMRTLNANHPDSPMIGMSHYNIAFIQASGLKDHAAALKAIEALVANEKINDKDPKPNLMDPFRNYRYHALRMAVESHKALGQPGEAFLACFRMKAAYVTHCGTCYRGMMGYYQRKLTGVVQHWMVEREGKVSTDDEKKVIAGLVGKAREEKPDAFLLELGRLYVEREQKAEAETVLQLMIETFPKSALVAKARQTLATFAVKENK